MKRIDRKLVGNILIFASIALVIYIYLPFINVLLPYDYTTAPLTSDYYISIPKINARAPIIANVNPWNEDEYRRALKHGVAQAKNNPNFLFAHSSLDPWEMTRTNTAFLKLNQLQNNDLIIIHKNGQNLRYKVYLKTEIFPEQISFMQQTGNNIILQTCTPVGTSLKRLLVFASPV